ncbi:hypothetical protein EZV62_012531 [Acer yangbiense]|uniref:Activator of Hsp90 ATPase AHSA1-like N-terminal domain-containing protein n=1 Tax=Acer yangbiense TaxID=1000413 RepID=A0A5C7HWI9_9ROSI|nr:hypothetical protein EZV62_012531 [Acer yangbiense]
MHVHCTSVGNSIARVDRTLKELLQDLTFSNGVQARMDGILFQRPEGVSYANPILGEWIIGGEKKMVKGHIDIPEFSFGELDELQMQVQLSEEKDLLQPDKLQISQDLKLFLSPVREKLVQFEQELKDR